MPSERGPRSTILQSFTRLIVEQRLVYFLYRSSFCFLHSMFHTLYLLRQLSNTVRIMLVYANHPVRKLME